MIRKCSESCLCIHWSLTGHKTMTISIIKDTLDIIRKYFGYHFTELGCRTTRHSGDVGREALAAHPLTATQTRLVTSTDLLFATLATTCCLTYVVTVSCCSQHTSLLRGSYTIKLDSGRTRSESWTRLKKGLFLRLCISTQRCTD